MQLEQNAILLPLTIGVSAIIFTIGIHALALATIIRLVRHERRLGRAGASFSIDMTIIAVGTLLMLSAHLTEMALWAGIFEACAQFPAFATALYYSAAIYTSLGYGDIVMSRGWKFLAPLETTDGMLMFGISTAAIFAIIQDWCRPGFRIFGTEASIAAGRYGHEALMLASPGHNQACFIKGHDAIEIITEGNRSYQSRGASQYLPSHFFKYSQIV